MREPSIHIRESDLILVLEKIKLKDYIKRKEIKKLGREIVARAKRLSASNRVLYISNDKLHKKATKIVKSGISEAQLFSQILTMERKRRRHRGIRTADPSHPDWLNIKETAGLAKEFCNEFGYNSKEGFIQYIQCGLNMMKNYSLNKFKSLHSAICTRHEALQEIDLDKEKDLTERLYQAYITKLLERTGISPNYKDQPEKFIGFKRGKDLSRALGLTPEIFVEAQFWALEFANGVPDPLQLFGDLAEQRAAKYCYQNQYTVKKSRPKVNLSKIKRDAHKD